MTPYLLVNENFVNWCYRNLVRGTDFIVSKCLLRFGGVAQCVQIDWHKYSDKLCNDDWCWENDIDWHEILNCRGEGGSNCSWDQHPYEPRNARRDGLFSWILDNTGASTTKNVAAVLSDIWRFERDRALLRGTLNYTPIDMFNSFSVTKGEQRRWFRHTPR